MARSEKSICWVVHHPEIGTAFVAAEDWERATVEEIGRASCRERV